MYQFNESFRLLDKDVEFLRSVDSENITINQRRYINAIYYLYVAESGSTYDLVAIEKQEKGNKNETRIKLRLLNWLADYMTATPDEDFFFRMLSCRPAAQILVTQLFSKV
jgi:hypothetical protein